MFTRLYASNYRSIGEGLDLKLGPLTVLVGPNGSGKSNILDVFRFLHDCVNRSLSDAIATRQGFECLSRWSAGKTRTIDVAIESVIDSGTSFWGMSLGVTEQHDDESDSDFMVTREFAGLDFPATATSNHSLDDFLRSQDGADLPKAIFSDKKIRAYFRGISNHRPLGVSMIAALTAASGTGFALRGVPAATRLVGAIQDVAIYSLFPNTLRAAQNPNPVKPMTSSGDNWASTLKALNKKEWGAELSDALKRITGDVDDYRVVQAGGYVIPEFRHGKGRSGKGVWRGAAQESDGTLRIAAMLTALFQEPAPSLIGFEEPELAVHPGALPILYDYLVEASKRSQIIITTHSPELMDLFDIDCIRVVERKQGVTTVGPVGQRQRDLVRKRIFSTSELLHAEGLHCEGSGNDE